MVEFSSRNFEIAEFEIGVINAKADIVSHCEHPLILLDEAQTLTSLNQLLTTDKISLLIVSKVENWAAQGGPIRNELGEGLTGQRRR